MLVRVDEGVGQVLRETVLAVLVRLEGHPLSGGGLAGGSRGHASFVGGGGRGDGGEGLFAVEEVVVGRWRMSGLLERHEGLA